MMLRGTQVLMGNDAIQYRSVIDRLRGLVH